MTEQPRDNKGTQYLTDDLRQPRTDVRQLAALDDLAPLLEQCAGTPGSYLRIQGD
ncbi:hypothetical protein [Streptomyces collinus]|uniref:hypothetical protein n=1 Tax=Streptomyces collinus TaxID=42684 RepID=UPI0036A83AC5